MDIDLISLSKLSYTRSVVTQSSHFILAPGIPFDLQINYTIYILDCCSH